MNAIVTDQNGNVVAGANWGDTDLSRVDIRQYPDIDLTEIATRSGFTGPRYVHDGRGGLGDVVLGRPVTKKNPPAAGYCPFQAEVDEAYRLAHELSAQR